jgi:hypothetical protein
MKASLCYLLNTFVREKLCRRRTGDAKNEAGPVGRGEGQVREIVVFAGVLSELPAWLKARRLQERGGVTT